MASVTDNGVSATHAYNANGSLTSSNDGRTVSYAAFGKAKSISKGGHSSAFVHGPNRSRFKRVDTDDTGKATTTLYIGSVEKVTHPDGEVTVRRRIGGVAIEVEGPAASFDGCATTRGFTGHEMLEAVGAVHMNGRIYDPALGRFLRADPFVQFPANLQSHNRYSYALNNPLSYTDPSGHFLKGLLHWTKMAF